jgi:Membrane bound beta barrel domain (DUF5777)
MVPKTTKPLIAMKNLKNMNAKLLLLTMALATFTIPMLAQEEAKEPTQDDGNKPARAHFESTWIIDNQTALMKQKGTFEFMIQHRFGSVGNGITDLYGLYAPSNIRLGFNYTLFDNFGFGGIKGPLAIGFGTTKDHRIQDFNIKYGVLEQTRNGRIPVSVSYYANAGMETIEPKDDLPNGNTSDRFSYFHQLIISRRFSSKLSVQLAPSVSHYNTVEPDMKNDHFAVSAAARYKFGTSTAVIVNVDQPITKHKINNPQPNFGLGIEMSTSSHTFQIFLTNYSAIVQQRNNVFNTNAGLRVSPEFEWDWDGFAIGFNINRLWNF